VRGERSTGGAEPLTRCFLDMDCRRKTDFHEECDGVDGVEGECMSACCFAVDAERSIVLYESWRTLSCTTNTDESRTSETTVGREENCPGIAKSYYSNYCTFNISNGGKKMVR